MQMYRHQAIMAETRMRARARQKLLERVQSVMNSIDVTINFRNILAQYESLSCCRKNSVTDNYIAVICET